MDSQVVFSVLVRALYLITALLIFCLGRTSRQQVGRFAQLLSAAYLVLFIWLTEARRSGSGLYWPDDQLGLGLALLLGGGSFWLGRKSISKSDRLYHQAKWLHDSVREIFRSGPVEILQTLGLDASIEALNSPRSISCPPFYHVCRSQDKIEVLRQLPHLMAAEALYSETLELEKVQALKHLSTPELGQFKPYSGIDALYEEVLNGERPGAQTLQASRHLVKMAFILHRLALLKRQQYDLDAARNHAEHGLKVIGSIVPSPDKFISASIMTAKANLLFRLSEIDHFITKTSSEATQADYERVRGKYQTTRELWNTVGNQKEIAVVDCMLTILSRDSAKSPDIATGASTS